MTTSADSTINDAAPNSASNDKDQDDIIIYKGIDKFLPRYESNDGSNTQDTSKGEFNTIDQDLRQLVGMNDERTVTRTISNFTDPSFSSDEEIDVVHSSPLRSTSSLLARSVGFGGNEDGKRPTCASNNYSGEISKDNAPSATGASVKSVPTVSSSQIDTTNHQEGKQINDEASISSQPSISGGLSSAPSVSSSATPSRPPRRQLFPPNTAPPAITTATDNSNVNSRNTYYNEKYNYVNKLGTNARKDDSNSRSGNNNNNKNAFDAFGDFLTVFFRKAEVYEEELEWHESQRALLDDDVLSVEHDGVVNGVPHADGIISPKLSPKMEAMAAVEAMSNFRAFNDVKLEKIQEGHLLDRQKIDGKSIKKVKLGEGGESISRNNNNITANDGEVEEVPSPVKEDEAAKEKWRGQWRKFCGEKKKSKFKEIAIQRICLPFSVNDFYQTIVQDDAVHSFRKFMTDIGEINVDATSWQPPYDPKINHMDNTPPSKRTIHYVHPINAPMAPPTAKACKTQYFHNFGPVGLCLETCTIVEDVPMTDCFVVDDRLWVYEDENDENGCVVEVTFNIRFVKTTMFRRIIENSTRNEFNKFWGQFGDMISSLEGPHREEEPSVKKEEFEDAIMTVDEEFEEGTEKVPLSTVISLIRESSMRLSPKIKAPSSKHLLQKPQELSGEESPPSDLLKSTIAYYASSGNRFLFICTVSFLLCLNFVALRQIMTMNQLMLVLNDRLDTIAQVNKALLSKLDESDVCN